MSEIKRKKVKKVVLIYEDDTNKEIDVDQNDGPAAICWGDFKLDGKINSKRNGPVAVELLGTFYNSLPERLWMDESDWPPEFGEKRKRKMFPKGVHAREINKAFIRELWSLPGDKSDDDYLVFAGKGIRCKLGGG